MSAKYGTQGRLWSLWDMMRIYADQYIALGERIADIRVIYHFVESDENRRGFHPSEQENIRGDLKKILLLCNDLELPVAFDLIQSRIDDFPKTEREFDLLMGAVYSELKKRIFVHIRPHLAKFYDNHDVLSARATLAFHSPRSELWEASNSLAAGLWTAAVFHSMRAAEIGVKLLGRELGVSFPDKPIDLAEWAQILDQADSKIKAISQKPKSEERDADQRFYSMAASQFRHFKDGWRVRVAHARADYTEESAVKIFEHTRDFFETLADRLKE